jgi:imidazolonepropionase-like amidohydrolase/Tol biopolymer transport system component
MSETREIELPTTRVTCADVAVSPDGAHLIFSLLGHLFRMPAAGGHAEQLTFGAAYDKEPVYSPDGTVLAFVSDRDGSESNIFLLALQSGALRQLTHETRADVPVFSPDGRSVFYARHVPGTLGSFPTRNPARRVCRVTLESGVVDCIATAPRRLGSIFFLPDGRAAWTVSERDEASGEYLTHLEAVSDDGTVSRLRAIGGIIDWAVAPAGGDLLYAHRVTGAAFEHWLPAATEDIVAFRLDDGPVTAVVPVGSPGRFALCADGASLYVGDRGRIYRVALPAATSNPVAFSARAKLTVRQRAVPVRAVASATVPLRTLQFPRISPDGATLVFGAAGVLWRQDLASETPAQRLTPNDVLESSPAFCPVGHALAYVERHRGRDSVVLLDLASGKRRVLHCGVGMAALNFNRDGTRLLATINRGFAHESVILIDVAGATTRSLFPVSLWSPRPSFAADGRSVYYCSDSAGVGNLYRRSLDQDGAAQALTRFADFVSEAQLTADERTLVFRRNRKLFTVPVTTAGIDEGDVRELSAEGGDAFALTPDGAGIICADGPRLWIQSLEGGARRELPVRLQLQVAAPPLTLIRRVRLLDFDSGTFQAESTALLDGGMIRRIGAGADRDLPPGATVIDAGGRYAIPGLFDFHVHCGDANAEAFIAFGITAVRDTGYNLDQLNTLANRSETSGAPLPRYFYSGELFESQRPYWGDRGSLLITSDTQARENVRRFRALGASFIKVYPSLNWQLQRTICDEALHQGLPVVGHGTSLEEITKGVILGLYSLEHLHLTTPVYDDVLTMLAASDTRWTPTLASMGADTLLLRDRPEEVAHPRFVGLTPPCACHFATFDAYKGVATATLRGIVAADLISIRRAHELGVQLHAGTDAPTPNCFFGSSLHWELERLVESGLTPLTVLRIATLDAARALGRPDLGNLAVGNAADLVLLDDDPLADIRNTRSIWRVMKGGWCFDPELLIPENQEVQ